MMILERALRYLSLTAAQRVGDAHPIHSNLALLPSASNGGSSIFAKELFNETALRCKSELFCLLKFMHFTIAPGNICDLLIEDAMDNNKENKNKQNMM